jgi:MFS family permease
MTAAGIPVAEATADVAPDVAADVPAERSRLPLRGWLASEAVSLTGTRVSMVALPFLVLTTTGSATRTGLVALAEMLPLVLLKVLGGPLIDRIGARRVSIACDTASVLAVGAVPVLHLLGALSLPVLLALVAVAGALRGPGDTAKQTLVPTIAEHAGVPVERVTGLAGTVERASSMLGAGLAGGLVALVGAPTALVVDAASFGFSALALALTTRALAGPAQSGRPAEPESDAGADADAPDDRYAEQLRQGWRFLRGDRLLLGLAVVTALTNFIDIAWVSVLVPVWAVDGDGGAGAIGLVFACFSGASAVGAACAAAWSARLPRFRTYLLGYLLCGAPRYAVLAFGAPVWLVLLVVATSGFGAGFLNPVLGAVAYERTPRDLLGRVSSLSSAMCFALMPLGGLAGGALVSGVGLPTALLATAAAYLLVTLVPAVDPTWREMDRRPGAVSGGTSAPPR